MTLICALKFNDKIYIAGDNGLTTDGIEEGYHTTNFRKVHKFNGYICGFAGDWGLIQRIVDYFESDDQKCMKILSNDDALLDLLKGEKSKIEALIAFGSKLRRLFKDGDSYKIREIDLENGRVIYIGSGASVAMDIFTENIEPSTTKYDPQGLLIEIINKTSKFEQTVRMCSIVLSTCRAAAYYTPTFDKHYYAILNEIDKFVVEYYNDDWNSKVVVKNSNI